MGSNASIHLQKDEIKAISDDTGTNFSSLSSTTLKIVKFPKVSMKIKSKGYTAALKT